VLAGWGLCSLTYPAVVPLLGALELNIKVQAVAGSLTTHQPRAGYNSGGGVGV